MSKTKDRRKEFKIPEDAKKMAKMTFKKFKKENEDYYDSKKELKKAYYAYLIDLLPVSVSSVINYGHIPNMKETKEAIFEKLTDGNLVKYLKKEIKNGGDAEIENCDLLPNVIYKIITDANKAVETEKAENPDANVAYDLDDLVEISHLILKKKIKKLTKSGINENVAFDVLSTIPTARILAKSQYHHIRQLFIVLYEHAKTQDIDFSKIMKVVFKDDDYVSSVITFALLERKEKISNFNDGQKKLFNDITEYCFKTMEEMKKEDIQAIIKAYVGARKKDGEQGKDTNRRYYISSLPESDYPKITKVVKRFINNNEDMKKYF